MNINSKSGERESKYRHTASSSHGPGSQGHVPGPSGAGDSGVTHLRYPEVVSDEHVELPPIRAHLAELFEPGVQPPPIVADVLIHGQPRVIQHVVNGIHYNPMVEWMRNPYSYKPIPG